MCRIKCNDVMTPFYCFMEMMITKTLCTSTRAARGIGNKYLRIRPLAFRMLRSCRELCRFLIFDLWPE